MTEQREKILQSVGALKKLMPEKFNPGIAVYLEKDMDLPEDLKILQKVNYEDIPPGFTGSSKETNGKLLFARCGKEDIIILHGRYHFYNGIKMRDIGHVIYVLKYLGIKTLISVDETGFHNPRFKLGDIALIYDHINLMGDNPLIGKNDDELGVRFPDMSDAYSKECFNKISALFIDRKIKLNEAVYFGVPGPETETEAESRFYTEIGADVTGYSLVPENITAVHCGIKFFGMSLLTRELLPDKMMEDTRSEKEMKKVRKDSFKKANTQLKNTLKHIIKALSN
ncbi:purine-nucleoside phosphorylase [soil metagenome]